MLVLKKRYANTIIRINRSLPVDAHDASQFPKWLIDARFEYPHLHGAGESKYDLSHEKWHELPHSALDHYSHNRKSYGGLKAQRGSSGFAECLGLVEGRKIQKKGPAFFKALFGERCLFLWRSVAQGTYPEDPDRIHTCVPVLCIKETTVFFWSVPSLIGIWLDIDDDGAF